MSRNNLHNEIEIRAFDYERDLPSVKRIWREVGWVDEDEEKMMDDFFACGDTVVATMNGEAECSVHIVDGSLRLQETDLPLCAVTAVTTSRIARGHAFAKRLTAQQLAASAERGAAVAALGMFDQGFYDQLGFGSGGYDHQLQFDPGTLRVDHRVPTPRRLSADDFAAVHSALVGRHKVHGSVVLNPPQFIKAEMGWSEGGFGLGYFERETLTHFMWFSGKAERGPYSVEMIGYRNTAELLELLGLLKSLADQVYAVKIVEPPEIQLQDLLDRPFRNRALTRGSTLSAEHRTFAWWQLRMLDVPACVAAFSDAATDLALQVDVRDPLNDMLPDGSAWQGAGGSYVLRLGPRSSAEPGTDSSLPQVRCSINALTRLFWGVAPASSLAVTDEFSASEETLAALDRAIRLPIPHTGWDF